MLKERRRVSVKAPLKGPDFLGWGITEPELGYFLLSRVVAAWLILEAEKDKYGPDLLRMIRQNDPRIDERTRLAHSLIVSSLRLIDSIAANKAEQAAMSMLEVCSYDSNLYTDERIRSSSKGGKAPKENKGLWLAVGEALKESELNTATSLLEYLKTEHTGEENALEIGNYGIYFYEDPTGSGKDSLYLVVYHDNGKEEKKIPLTTFKRYVPKVKKSLINDSTQKE